MFDLYLNAIINSEKLCCMTYLKRNKFDTEIYIF